MLIYTDLCVKKPIYINIKKDNSVTKRITGSNYWHIKQFILPNLIIINYINLIANKFIHVMLCFSILTSVETLFIRLSNVAY